MVNGGLAFLKASLRSYFQGQLALLQPRHGPPGRSARPSLFGQQLLTVQMYCNTCHTPFECIKDDDILDEFARRKEDQA